MDPTKDLVPWVQIALPWVQIVTSVSNSIVFIIGAVWAILLYQNQKNDNFEAGKQANRSRLTEAYMNWHAAILSERTNVAIISALLRRASHVLERESGKPITVDQTYAIHILYMMLNALYLEFDYRNLYKLPMTELDRTVDHAVNGLVSNPTKDFRDIIDNFDEVLPSWRLADHLKK